MSRSVVASVVLFTAAAAILFGRLALDGRQANRSAEPRGRAETEATNLPDVRPPSVTPEQKPAPQVNSAPVAGSRATEDELVTTSRLDAETERAVEQAIWETLYAEATLAQISAEIKVVRSLLHERSSPYYKAKFDAGGYEISGHYTSGKPYVVPTDDRLMRLELSSNGEVRRVVLPESDFPDAYKLQRQVSWLMGRKSELKLYEQVALDASNR